MPNTPKRPCTYPGCGVLTNGGRCEAHKQVVERQRGSAHQRGYTSRWAAYSKARLRTHPLCECPDCQAGALRVRAATVTDHIVPHKGDMHLFWDKKNHRSMAKECHDRKTATEDGGFGNAQAGGGQKY